MVCLDLVYFSRFFWRQYAVKKWRKELSIFSLLKPLENLWSNTTLEDPNRALFSAYPPYHITIGNSLTLIMLWLFYSQEAMVPPYQVHTFKGMSRLWKVWNSSLNNRSQLKLPRNLQQPIPPPQSRRESLLTRNLLSQSGLNSDLLLPHVSSYFPFCIFGSIVCCTVVPSPTLTILSLSFFLLFFGCPR